MSTPALNRALEAAVRATPPPSPGGRPLRFYYATQTGRRPPAIAVFANHPDTVPSAYARHLRGRLAAAFRLTGVPLLVHFRARRTSDARGRRRASGARGRRSAQS